MLGMVGEHEEDFPIEKLSLTRDRRIVSSISHDNCVRLWSVAHLSNGSAASSGVVSGGGDKAEEEDDDSDMDFRGKGGGFGSGGASQSFKKKPARAKDNAGFFDDL